jgi:glycerophosphoryl diester phosphodiesterase
MQKYIQFLFSSLVGMMMTVAVGACSKTGKATEGDKAPTSPIIILHAGGGVNGLRYLNAQETFEGYYQQGYRYFEYDLKLSTDGKLIASHAGEHLGHNSPENLTYHDFTELKLSNGYTPANEEWLVQTMISYPDVKIVVDAKMPDTAGDVAVLQRIEALENIYHHDFSANVIPEVFSKEMWDALKETTSFDRYLFSHYKVYYSIDSMLEYFNDERIWGIALPMWSDNYIRSNIYRLKEAGKQIMIFTPSSKEEAAEAFSLGADGIYVDTPNIV